MPQKGNIFIGILIGFLIAGGLFGAYYLGNTTNTKTSLQPSTKPTLTPISANQLPSPSVSINSQNSQIGKGIAKIQLAYYDRTNLEDPTIKTNTDSDIQYVTEIMNDLPILGYPLVSLSAQNRYGYTFPAVNGQSIATYNSTINQLFINMETRDKHVILHETAHYLDPKSNSKNLSPYLTESTLSQAIKTRDNLLNNIRKYDNKPQLDTDIMLNQKIKEGLQVSWQEIVDAANVYSTEIWKNPKNYLQFQNQENIDQNEVKSRADSELYAEFTAFLLRAQKANSYDRSYQHPVYKLFADIKK